MRLSTDRQDMPCSRGCSLRQVSSTKEVETVTSLDALLETPEQSVRSRLSTSPSHYSFSTFGAVTPTNHGGAVTQPSSTLPALLENTDDAAIFVFDTVDASTAQMITNVPSALAVLTPQRHGMYSSSMVGMPLAPLFSDYDEDSIGVSPSYPTTLSSPANTTGRCSPSFPSSSSCSPARYYSCSRPRPPRIQRHVSEQEGEGAGGDRESSVPSSSLCTGVPPSGRQERGRRPSQRNTTDTLNLTSTLTPSQQRVRSHPCPSKSSEGVHVSFTEPTAVCWREGGGNRSPSFHHDTKDHFDSEKGEAEDRCCDDGHVKGNKSTRVSSHHLPTIEETRDGPHEEAKEAAREEVERHVDRSPSADTTAGRRSLVGWTPISKAPRTPGRTSAKANKRNPITNHFVNLTSTTTAGPWQQRHGNEGDVLSLLPSGTLKEFVCQPSPSPRRPTPSFGKKGNIGRVSKETVEYFKEETFYVDIQEFEKVRRERNRLEKMYEHQKALYMEVRERHEQTYKMYQAQISQKIALSDRLEVCKSVIRQQRQNSQTARSAIISRENEVMMDLKTKKELIREKEMYRQKYERLLEDHTSKLAAMESLYRDLYEMLMDSTMNEDVENEDASRQLVSPFQVSKLLQSSPVSLPPRRSSPTTPLTTIGESFAIPPSTTTSSPAASRPPPAYRTEEGRLPSGNYRRRWGYGCGCCCCSRKSIHISQLDNLLKASYTKNTGLVRELVMNQKSYETLWEEKSRAELQSLRTQKVQHEKETRWRKMLSQREREYERLHEENEHLRQSILDMRQLVIRTIDPHICKSPCSSTSSSECIEEEGYHEEDDTFMIRRSTERSSSSSSRGGSDTSEKDVEEDHSMEEKMEIKEKKMVEVDAGDEVFLKEGRIQEHRMVTWVPEDGGPINKERDAEYDEREEKEKDATRTRMTHTRVPLLQCDSPLCLPLTALRTVDVGDGAIPFAPSPSPTVPRDTIREVEWTSKPRVHTSNTKTSSSPHLPSPPHVAPPFAISSRLVKKKTTTAGGEEIPAAWIPCEGVAEDEAEVGVDVMGGGGEKGHGTEVHSHTPDATPLAVYVDPSRACTLSPLPSPIRSTFPPGPPHEASGIPLPMVATSALLPFPQCGGGSGEVPPLLSSPVFPVSTSLASETTQATGGAWDHHSTVEDPLAVTGVTHSSSTGTSAPSWWGAPKEVKGTEQERKECSAHTTEGRQEEKATWMKSTKQIEGDVEREHDYSLAWHEEAMQSPHLFSPVPTCLPIPLPPSFPVAVCSTLHPSPRLKNMLPDPFGKEEETLLTEDSLLQNKSEGGHGGTHVDKTLEGEGEAPHHSARSFCTSGAPPLRYRNRLGKEEAPSFTVVYRWWSDVEAPSAEKTKRRRRKDGSAGRGLHSHPEEGGTLLQTPSPPRAPEARVFSAEESRSEHDDTYSRGSDTEQGEKHRTREADSAHLQGVEEEKGMKEKKKKKEANKKEGGPPSYSDPVVSSCPALLNTPKQTCTSVWLDPTSQLPVSFPPSPPLATPSAMLSYPTTPRLPLTPLRAPSSSRAVLGARREDPQERRQQGTLHVCRSSHTPHCQELLHDNPQEGMKEEASPLLQPLSTTRNTAAMRGSGPASTTRTGKQWGSPAAPGKEIPSSVANLFRPPCLVTPPLKGVVAPTSPTKK